MNKNAKCRRCNGSGVVFSIWANEYVYCRCAIGKEAEAIGCLGRLP